MFKLCQETDDPSTYLKIVIKLGSMQKPWYIKWLKRQMKARYVKFHTEQDKKAYQHVRNIYLYKLNKAKLL